MRRHVSFTTPDAAPRLIDIIDALSGGKEVFSRHVRTVGDVMSREFTYLTLDATIGSAIEIVRDRTIRHIPVVEEVQDKEGKEPPSRTLVGIISHRDIVRVLSRGVGMAGEADQDHKTMKDPIATIVVRDVLTVTPSTPFIDAVQQLLKNRVGCLPVVDAVGGREPRGMLTTADVIKCFSRMDVLRKLRDASSSGSTQAPKRSRLVDLARSTEGQPMEVLVGQLMGRVDDVMEEDPQTVEAEDKLAKAVELMRERGLRSLPVVDARGKLRGIINDRDVFAYLPPRPPPKRVKGQTGSVDLYRIDPSDVETKQTLSEKVAAVMTPKPTTTDPGAPLAKVAEFMLSERLDAMAVVDPETQVVQGMLSQTDILRALTAVARMSKA